MVLLRSVAAIGNVVTAQASTCLPHTPADLGQSLTEVVMPLRVRWSQRVTRNIDRSMWVHLGCAVLALAPKSFCKRWHTRFAVECRSNTTPPHTIQRSTLALSTIAQDHTQARNGTHSISLKKWLYSVRATDGQKQGQEITKVCEPWAVRVDGLSPLTPSPLQTHSQINTCSTVMAVVDQGTSKAVSDMMINPIVRCACVQSAGAPQLLVYQSWYQQVSSRPSPSRDSWICHTVP